MRPTDVPGTVLLRERAERQPGAGRALRMRATRRRPEEATTVPQPLALTSRLQRSTRPVRGVRVKEGGTPERRSEDQIMRGSDGRRNNTSRFWVKPGMTMRGKVRAITTQRMTDDQAIIF